MKKALVVEGNINAELNAQGYSNKALDCSPDSIKGTSLNGGKNNCDAWPQYHYHKLFVGSDYKGSERFLRYEEYFKDKDAEIVYLPYTQSTSSTQIRKTIVSKTQDLK